MRNVVGLALAAAGAIVLNGDLLDRVTAGQGWSLAAPSGAVAFHTIFATHPIIGPLPLGLCPCPAVFVTGTPGR
jgi:hypothetical protein